LEKYYNFFEGNLPSDYSLEFEESLFNSHLFYPLQDPDKWVSFYVLMPSEQKAAAGIHFHVDGDLARSPYRAPFGSIEFCTTLAPLVLYKFFEYIEVQLTKRGVREIRIKNPPHAYAPACLSLVETVLINQGYQVVTAELSTLIEPDAAVFSERIRHSEKLRLQQAKNAGCTFRRWQVESLEELYNFLSRCHEEKGYQVSMTYDDLRKTVVTFPDRYLLFGIVKEAEVIAASISIKINQNCLYTFFANHDRKYNSLSPLILLMESIYVYCQENQIRLLDLGTSALQGKPNFNLLDFKLHIGGVPSAKVTFNKKIA
jgi:hypothetical protein